jgi:hypothetical protein
MADGADREPVMNLGHIAAWGALVATQLTASRVRYTKMTRDHIVFVPSDNRVRVVGGGSGILPIGWPSEARLHHEDIALFHSEFGSSLTSALRLGYGYRLGPIGEWIFFEPDDGSAVFAPPPGPWSEEWDAPTDELRLGNDCSLDANEMADTMAMGSTYRRQGDLVAAKRCFMRCCLAAIASVNEVAMAVALGNLATAYRDEGRWLRVFASSVVAAFLASTLPSEAQDWIGRLLNETSTHEPTASDRMATFAEDRARMRESFPEIIWRLEDYAIQGELARETSSS